MADGVDWYCRACRSMASKRYRLGHPKRLGIQRRRAYLKHHLRKILYLLDHPCVDCGNPDPLALEFDHVEEKRDSISSMLKNKAAWEAIQKEMAKCEVRCSNCHRRRHLLKLGWPDYLGLWAAEAPTGGSAEIVNV